MSENDDGSRYPSRTLEKVVVRLPDGMRDRLKSSAEISGRSVNSEIVQRLTRSFLDEGSDALRLELSGDLWNALMMDAHAHDQSTEDRAADLLKRFFTKDSVFEEPTEYARALDKLSEKMTEVIDLEDKLALAKQNLNNDFLLYWNKTAQLRNLIDFVLSDKDSVLSERLKSAAYDMEKLIKAEIKLLEDRHWGAQYHRSLKEQADAENREDDIHLEEIIPSKTIRDLDKKSKS